MYKKLDKKLMIIGIILGLIIVSVGGFAIYRINKNNSHLTETPIASEKPETTLNPGKIDKPIDSSDDIHAALMDASYYDTMNTFGFSFYIATLSITSDKAINVDLSHFTTSEGIKLNEVDQYVKTLEEKQFFLGKENVVYQLISLDNSSLFNVFVPVTKDANISLSCDLDMEFKAEFNAKMNPGSVNDLFYEANDIISDGKTYQLKVSEAFDATGLYFTKNVDGNIREYTVASTVSIFTFQLDVVSLFGDKIEIESATYISDNEDQIFNALGSEIQCEKYVNIIGQMIDDSGKGYLFFEALNSYEHEVFYSGQLHLKVKGNDADIVVNVDLN